MTQSARRFQYEKAQEIGDEMDVFVKRETGSWEDPIISTEEVAEQFDLTVEEAHERLSESDLVVGRDIGETRAWW